MQQAQAVLSASPNTSPIAIDERSSFIASAVENCRDRGLNMTPICLRILEVVAASPKSIAAYAIIHRLSGTKMLGPATVYRALDFLVDAGFVRHLAYTRAYALRVEPCEPLVAVLTCTACGGVNEASSDEVRAAVVRIAAAAGFTAERQAIKIAGWCATCARAPTRHI